MIRQHPRHLVMQPSVACNVPAGIFRHNPRVVGEDANDFVLTKPGLIALGTDLPPESSIQSFFHDQTIVQISCGSNHSAVICNSGRVYCFGKNQDNGWVENGPDMVTEPRLIASLAAIRVTQAACGVQFTLFLTDKGELYSCGENAYGQLGLGHTNKSPTPVLVTGLPPIKKIAAGGQHTVALAGSGEVWVTGLNNQGQLGLGHRNNEISFASVLNLSESIIDISCGMHHTALLSKSQILLMSGANDKGQLGLSTLLSTHLAKSQILPMTGVSCRGHPALKNPYGTRLSPSQTSIMAGADTIFLDIYTQVSIPSMPVAAVSCGDFHTLALRVDGTIWSWGSNDMGQLGTGKSAEAYSFTPTKMIGLENYIISKVIAGCNHSGLLTKGGDMLVCGRGCDGELGQGKENLFMATLLPKSTDVTVEQVAFAEKSILILVEPKSTTAPRPQLQRAVLTLQDSQTRDCLTDWERCIMRSLECPICFKIMCAPIHLCSNGHSLCNACRSHKDVSVCPLCQGLFTNGRNIALENHSVDIQLPCVECLIRMPTCELEKHGEVCPNRKYSCPVQRSCGWSGRPDTMLAHTSSAHPDQTWRDLPHSFVHSTLDELVHTDVLAAHNEVFTLHRKYDKTTGEFLASVRYIGPTANKEDYNLEFMFISENEERMYRRNISADIVKIDDTFESSNCVCVKKEFIGLFLQQDQLMCRATIVKVDTSACTD